jgi:hypothetical protein
LSSGDTFSITNNEDFKELKGIEDSKLIDTAHQLHDRSSKDLSKENTPLIGLIKEDPEYVFKVISSHQSEYNDWALELYLNCIVYSDEGFQQKIANPLLDLSKEYFLCLDPLMIDHAIDMLYQLILNPIYLLIL